MPTLTYFANENGAVAERLFRDFADESPLALNVDSTNGRDESHAAAIITRSRLYQVSVLVNLTGKDVRVNGRRVVGLRVLRQGAFIQLGELRLRFWEMTLTLADATLTRKRCPVCRIAFEVGDEVIICPRCKGPYHKGCYLEHDYCPDMAGCFYPVRATLKRVLAAHDVRLETLAANSDLVAQGQRCAAGTPLDREPFRAEQTAVYCPECGKPFHLECWIHLDQCPGCQTFSVKGLLRRILLPGEGSHE